MTALELPDGGLAGIVAWYSIIHTPPEHLPSVFAELFRVLAPGGHLALASRSATSGRTCPRPTATRSRSTSTGCAPTTSPTCCAGPGSRSASSFGASRRSENTPQAYLVARKAGEATTADA